MSDCKCGCGKKASYGRDFLQGHDTKLSSKIKDEVGGILTLEKLVGAAKDYSCGKMKEAEFLKVVSKIFEKKTKNTHNQKYFNPAR
ncbi:MAG: hypothetical protein KKF01_09900 [Proteobacteria bacterium]|nr:hypothetical protein [Pseudomonadota bacterium]